MGKSARKDRVLPEALIASALALGLYLPFLSIQYDTNGMAEAAALEAGQLINKNHMLYRPIGVAAYRAAQYFGYAGNSLHVLQIINAVCGAAGIGFAYAVFKWATRDRTAATIGVFWLGSSFMYWVFSTDAAYLIVAATFVLSALTCILYTRTWWGLVMAAVLASLSVLTWQANLFVVPAMLLFIAAAGIRPVMGRVSVFAVVTGLVVAGAYITTAFVSRGFMGPKALWVWFTNYSENGTLPLWGVWDFRRAGTAFISAIGSIVPMPLAVSPLEIARSTQLGRIAVDVALLSLALVIVLAALKAGRTSLLFVVGYVLFFPFIVWWDPFPPVWFLIPNVFLAGFLSCGLQPWLQRRFINILVAVSLVVIAGANFITSIRPRHSRLGPERMMARCVAEHMQPSDLFIAAEWGWPDYLQYLHGRTALNLLNETAYTGGKERTLSEVRSFIASRRREGATVYIADPRDQDQQHLALLKAQTGITMDDLLAFGGSPVFSCSGKQINKL
jgi:hypothetical protein